MRASIRAGLALTAAIVTAAACGYYDESLLKTDPLGGGGSGDIGGAAGTSGASDGGMSPGAGGGGASGQANGGKGGSAGSGGGSGGVSGGGAGGTGGMSGGKGGSAGQAGTTGGAGMSGGSGGSAGQGGGGSGGDGQAGQSGAAGSAGMGGTSCVHSQPVAPPTQKNLGGTTEFIAVVHTADFHEGSDYKMLGYDLDKTCTCEGEPDSCVPSKTAKPGATCDGPDGRDNAAGTIISSAGLLGLSSSNLNDNIAKGGASVIFRVRNYNGLPDDDQVEVAWLVTRPLADQTDAGSKMPVWDGNDVWPINGSSVGKTGGMYDLMKPLFLDMNAYVSGGTIVASLKGDAPVQLNPNFVLTLRATFMTATVAPSGSTFKLTNGLIAGRWPAKNLLGQLGFYMIGGAQLCTDNSLYPLIKQTICDSVDILSSLGTSTDLCDAISTAFAFTADPAKIGDVFPPDMSVVVCPPATDPASDSCN